MMKLLKIFCSTSATWVKMPQDQAHRNTLLIPPQANVVELHVRKQEAAFLGAVLSK